MSKKGLDSTFLHFGIRKEDIQLIETICEKHELDFDWVKDFLIKQFHEKKIRNQEIDDKTVSQIIDKALQKIK
ncbi:DNA modification system-associated small protein [uncultured Polaribacter sp.]|mgnify:CR=1 FL=1|uniref:DNA modification system-associated small protein n=1 Tax=uncultured Polaribacter sp. TaxID=174711 RepID=UPI00259B96CE|nr:DNA modification system-associated small protein [uncultured Polaribacter sp.]